MYHALNVLISLSGNSGSQGKIAELMSSHPDTAKRAQHIKEMAEAAGYKMTTSNQNNSNNSGNTGNSGGKSGGGKKIKVGKG